MGLRLRPTTISEAKAIVGRWHRHNGVPQGGLFAVACEDGSGVIRGVAIVGRPAARVLDDGRTCEVTRLCTDGAVNACSLLYGACYRAAKALGYSRIYTYTLAEESGASLRATGWVRDADLPARPSWSCPARPRAQMDLFGEPRRPPGPKVRWVKQCREDD